MSEFIKLSVGEKYPLPIPKNEGAHAEFLRDGNILKIRLDSITPVEEKSLRTGTVKAGILTAPGAILWLFRFFDKKERPLLTLDAPFDARLIPTDQIQFHNIQNSEQRLLIEMHAIDGSTGILHAFRVVTLPPEIALQFLCAVQDQLASVVGEDVYRLWMQKEPVELFKMAKTCVIGK